MSRFYDYHAELELPTGVTDHWGACSLAEETALQVLEMLDHRGANASDDFTARLRIYGNTQGVIKHTLLRSKEIKVRAGFNIKRDYLRPLILEIFKVLR
jgi:hypothetical protein